MDTKPKITMSAARISNVDNLVSTHPVNTLITGFRSTEIVLNRPRTWPRTDDGAETLKYEYAGPKRESVDPYTAIKMATPTIQR